VRATTGVTCVCVCVCVCASSETDVGHRARRERGGRDDDIRERIVDL